MEKNKGGFKFYDFKKIMRLLVIIYYSVIRDSLINELLFGRFREIVKGIVNIIIYVLCYLVWSKNIWLRICTIYIDKSLLNY